MEFGAKEEKKNKALDVFKNFKGRHTGLIKALTTDVEEFFKQCDPDPPIVVYIWRIRHGRSNIFGESEQLKL